MAGDWLKVEKDTPEKPEIAGICAALNIPPDVAFSKCFKVWRWADSNTVDGHVKRVTFSFLDSLVGLPGFAQALVDVGWLRARDGALELPNFDRHMGQPAKARALATDRKRKERDKPCHADVTPETRPEKRREEKTKDEDKTKTARSVPPSVEDVQEYCATKSYGIDPELFVAHYTANGWVQSNGQKIRDWRAAVVTWEKRRKKEGHPAYRHPPRSRDDDVMDELRDAQRGQP